MSHHLVDYKDYAFPILLVKRSSDPKRDNSGVLPDEASHLLLPVLHSSRSAPQLLKIYVTYSPHIRAVKVCVSYELKYS